MMILKYVKIRRQIQNKRCFVMIKIVLVEPEIPQNAGNIARTCACIGAELHMIEPFGFRLSNKYFSRSGCDYWDKVKIVR